ncbi:hypothetical protein D9611_000806 [Ephemerocybe angulata]|uniref:DUF4470 domain-containing protein n=1 Tax=Ephemerocybe angulata TaxID=980116 RepID=A0A8H5BLJ8_9AGAR|nr:hypothetical protein D9611_000806 [Tulosesus angulatus]
MSTQAERALNAKNKGNVHFKAGRLEEAAKYYQEAVGFDPASVIYPSNLSAAFYELGQYDSCCRSILNAWTLVDGAADAAIAKKLSLRLAKALVLGLQDGTISQQLVSDNQSIIEAVRVIAQDDPSWGVYRELEEKIQSGTYEIAKKDAKKRFAHLPLFHGTPDPQMTFFTFGTDDLMSLADGWGSDEPDPLPLKDFTSEQLGNLSFLIAGCGDARHAFSTLVGLHNTLTPNPRPKAMQSQSLGLLHDFGLTQEQKDSVKIHLTLLDIHPATIARDVIFFMFLDQLVNMEVQISNAERKKERGKEKAGGNSEITIEDMKLEKLEVVTTLFYLYCGYMLPTYCYDRWVAAVKQLHAIISRPVTSVGGPSLPSYIFLPPSSFPAIIPYLNHWLQPPVGTIKFTRLMKHVGGFERTRQLQELHASGALGPKYSGMPDPIVMQQREAEEKVDALLSGRTSINRASRAASSSSARKEFKDKAAKERQSNERDLRTVLTKLLGYSEDEVLKMPFTKLRQKVKDSREDLIDLLVCMKMDRSVMYGVHGSMLREGEWVAAGASPGDIPSGMGLGPSLANGGSGVGVHVPPRELREKYHGKQFDLWMARIAKDDKELMANADQPSSKKAASSKVGKKQGSKSSSSSSSNSGSWYHAKNDWDKGRLVQSAKAIRASWKANMSLDDGKHGTRDQELDLDLFQTIHYFAEFDEIYGLGNGENGEGLLNGDEGYERKRESPAWAYGAAFFMGVVEAIKELTLGEDEGEGRVSGGGDRLKIEFVADGLHEYLAKMRAHAEDTRPETFPTKWTRIWLGSVPDYTNGTLNTVTYVVPALQDDVPTSSVASNCLFNSPVWADDNEFCYNYTMLLPSDLKRYLALHTINPNAVQDILDVNSYQPLPRPLSTLATKPELFSWLTKLFLSHIHPGYTQPRPRLVKMPNGLPAFFGLLVRLREIGYPGHWLSEWVQNVLDGEASADSLIYKDTLPRPLREKGGGRAPLHKVRLDPWLLELEWILATGKDSLPFSVRLPPSIFDGKEATSYRDIGTFEAKGLEPTIEYGMFYNHDAVAALLFYKSTKDIGGSKYFKDMLLKVGKIVDNVEISEKDTVPKGAFFILTAPEHVNLGKVPAGMKRAVGGGLEGMMAELMRGAMGGADDIDDGPGRGEARWRMGKASAKRMIREKWNMVVFRMDLWMPLTHPCPASKWIFQND